MISAALTALTISACGGGGGGGSSAGIGGTGISNGSVSGFGSVIVNAFEHITDTDTTYTLDDIGGDESDLGVGMVVTVTYYTNGDTKSILYKDNAEGPVSDISLPDNRFNVLGLDVTVNALTVFSGGIVGLADLNANDVVEVSGLLTDTNALRATRVELIGTCASVGFVEVKGTVSNVSTGGNGGFDIGSLNIDANGLLPVGLDDGDYVEVQSNACPVANQLTATLIEYETQGPDLSDLEDPEGGMEIKGIIGPNPSGSGTNCSLTVNGQVVNTNAGTEIEGTDDCADLTAGLLVEVHGSLNGSGVLIAGEVSLEDDDEAVDDEIKGIIDVTAKTDAFNGTIFVDSFGPYTVDLSTRFEGDTRDFNLDTMDGVCAEVYLNAAGHALKIEQEDDCPI
jgi:hypothetical protein